MEGLAGDLGIEGLEDAQQTGRGGFSTVYRAYQPRFDRHVAAKVLLGPTTTTTTSVVEPEPEQIGPTEAVPGWAADHSQYRVELLAVQTAVGASLEREQQACAERDAIRDRWEPTLVPAPDPVLSGDATELFSAAEQYTSICIETPWVIETDRSTVERMEAAHWRIVDQIYLLGTNYTGR